VVELNRDSLAPNAASAIDALVTLKGKYLPLIPGAKLDSESGGFAFSFVLNHKFPGPISDGPSATTQFVFNNNSIGMAGGTKSFQESYPPVRHLAYPPWSAQNGASPVSSGNGSGIGSSTGSGATGT
jgi:hypothetical protein